MEICSANKFTIDTARLAPQLLFTFEAMLIGCLLALFLAPETDGSSQLPLVK